MSDVVPFRRRQPDEPGGAPLELQVFHGEQQVLWLSSASENVLIPQDADERSAVLAMLANAIWALAGGVERDGSPAG